ncbi:hypothetical protein [Nocardioides panaciterrulae]|uniref:Uncharacterized protein n=1 Tax=Nocardioides panaciterrulae TaxID=661492 RepID=A0A7Y9E732_9ACTN|nr:hypothetical protein [Nocardioides panaciterrulae]NYD42140.1 hypothetical protein [Nocardioides panaciterrulae]
MSKMDDLRAMREARYEQMTARAAKPVATPPKRQRPARVESTPVASAPAADGSEALEAALCGHRAISGRTCTREQGHAAKSHRYS